METNFHQENNMSKIHPVVARIIEQAIAKYYMNRRKVPFRFVVRAVRWMVDEENRHRCNDDQLRQPSYSTVCKRIKWFNNYNVIARRGKRCDNAGIRVFRQDLQTPMPLELEIDSTKLEPALIFDSKHLRSEYDSLLDLQLIVAGMSPNKFFLFMATDQYSRRSLSASLLPAEPTFDDVLKTLRSQ